MNDIYRESYSLDCHQLVSLTRNSHDHYIIGIIEFEST